MQIHKFVTSEDGTKGDIEPVHEVKWPIVSRLTCLDPFMISVIQYGKCLYYFRVVNLLDEGAEKEAEVVF